LPESLFLTYKSKADQNTINGGERKYFFTTNHDSIFAFGENSVLLAFVMFCVFLICWAFIN
jgi:hypothetical protein